MVYPNFKIAIEKVTGKLINTGYHVTTEKWQGLDLKDKPQYQMWEALGIYFQCFMTEYTNDAIGEIKPNLEWANLHFSERIGGLPLNPGESYKVWPYYSMDDKMRSENKQFSHTYMERLWPRYAGQLNDIGYHKVDTRNFSVKRGIRYEYGNFQDVIDLLHREPFTRQAYLPIWFPEDTGANHGGRVPCTLGYHFIRRGDYLHIFYDIRSCDFYRHFRDDIYLAYLKVKWVISELQRTSEKWENVKPGIFSMRITSLHIFSSELPKLQKEI